ncbi:MAG: metal-dependent phosphohydrolase [Candidatus Uhrbacteria bacterium]|nr:metal-dependent phosphohydrolase [Candidatus Uhrbacteria bacterium]
MHLSFRWVRLRDALHFDGDVEKTAQRLLERYSESHRKYHTVLHLAHVLGEIDETTLETREAALVELGAWFHDAIHDPELSNNEEMSARLATKVLSHHGLNAEDIATVSRLVLDTKAHTPSDDVLSPVLLDADLAILGQPWDVYHRYIVRVREEFGFIPDRLWRMHRPSFLGGFITRDRLFFTPRAFERYEAQARSNMVKEIELLTT